METPDQKRRRIYGRQYLSEYLNIFEKILNIKITEKDLLSLEDVDKIISGGRAKLYFEKIIPFNDKRYFHKLVTDHILGFNEPAFTFIEHSLECGAAKIQGLHEFNFNFKFDDEPAGLISIMIERTSEELLLDFYEENSIRLMKVSIYNNFNSPPSSPRL